MDQDYIILIDMDQVIDDLMTSWVKILNEDNGLNVKVEDITEWEMSKAFPTLSKEEIVAPLRTERLWRDVIPMPGALEGLDELLDKGYNIKICTASCPQSFFYKYKYFISTFLPRMADYHNIICTHDKWMVKANVLLDDNINNLIKGDYKGVLFTTSYNKQYDEKKYGLVRVNSWEEFVKWVDEDYKVFRARKNCKKF